MYNPGMPEFRCKICDKVTTYEGRLPELYPFCSDRCRWVDLNKWFQGEYAIERELLPEETDQQQPPPNSP